MVGVGSISSHFVGPAGGLVMSLIAFSIVFMIIMGLMFLMMALKHICKAIDSVSGAKEQSKPETPAASHPATPAKAVASQSKADDASELLAVISAAIAATCGGTARVVSFTPVKIKQPVLNSWKFVGRIQNIEGFQD